MFYTNDFRPIESHPTIASLKRGTLFTAEGYPGALFIRTPDSGIGVNGTATCVGTLNETASNHYLTGTVFTFGALNQYTAQFGVAKLSK